MSEVVQFSENQRVYSSIEILREFVGTGVV